MAGVALCASITTTSMSASVYGINELHFAFPVSSAQPPPFHFTIKPTFGAAGKPGARAGDGGGGPPLAVTCASGTIVVWLPDSKIETKTWVPAASRAKERGCLPLIAITCGVAAGVAGSKTFTALKPETQTNADSLSWPANTTSVGSSPTSKLRETLKRLRSTTLTESDSQFTTQASLLLRAATLTGSSPTGISAISANALPAT